MSEMGVRIISAVRNCVKLLYGHPFADRTKTVDFGRVTSLDWSVSVLLSRSAWRWRASRRRQYPIPITVDYPIRQGVPTAQGYLGISNVEGVGGVGGVELLYWCVLSQCHR